MAAKKVKKSNVRQDDPYDSRARNAKSLNEFTKRFKDFYDVEVARSGNEVMFESRKKSSGGAAGPTITNPYILREDAEKRTKRQSKSANGSSTKKR